MKLVLVALVSLRSSWHGELRDAWCSWRLWHRLSMTDTYHPPHTAELMLKEMNWNRVGLTPRAHSSFSIFSGFLWSKLSPVDIILEKQGPWRSSWKATNRKFLLVDICDASLRKSIYRREWQKSSYVITRLYYVSRLGIWRHLALKGHKPTWTPQRLCFSLVGEFLSLIKKRCFFGSTRDRTQALSGESAES